MAWITLALDSLSRPEQTSLLPPSTDHRVPWAPASAMAPGQRGEGVGGFSEPLGSEAKESTTLRSGPPSQAETPPNHGHGETTHTKIKMTHFQCYEVKTLCSVQEPATEAHKL